MLRPFFLLVSTSVAAIAPTGDDPDSETLARTMPHSVVVQPIVVCDDNGQGPATMRIREPLIDQVYAKAGVDFHFLEPIRYTSRKARDGEINLDQIVRESRKAGILRSGGDLINMFFVNAVDGQAGPLGRGQQNGSILFICLGDKPNRGMEAFVVAHEAGHNLNLRHAVDDEHVPDDVPNLMGDGPYEQRVGPDGLTDYQTSEILKSRLVRKRVLCLDAQSGRRAIVDETFEPYFSQLQRAEIAALTATAPRGETLAGCREQARQRFQDAVLPFTEREAEALSFLVTQLEDRVRTTYPLLARQPWRFIKTANHLCGGFSWTRGLCIVFSQRTVERILTSRNSQPADQFLKRHGPLLLHEQMHVLQRVYPGRFADLYTNGFGFLQATVEPDAWLTERQMANPDALRLEWVFPLGGSDGRQKHIWPRTILKRTGGVPIMGRDFRMLAVEVQKDDATWRVKTQDGGDPIHDPAAFAAMVRRFGVSGGGDHPNEITAYMMPQLVFPPETGERPASVALQRLADWCRENLR